MCKLINCHITQQSTDFKYCAQTIQNRPSFAIYKKFNPFLPKAHASIFRFKDVFEKILINHLSTLKYSLNVYLRQQSRAGFESLDLGWIPNRAGSYTARFLIGSVGSSNGSLTSLLLIPVNCYIHIPSRSFYTIYIQVH